MVLTFFSQTSGGCTTSNALAIAMQSALEGNKTVVLDLNFDSYQAGQIAFIKNEIEVTGLNYYENVGLDALIRNVLAKTMSKYNIYDIETEIEKNLFYIPKTIKREYELYINDISKTFKAIVRALDLYHDVVIIDAGYGIAEINNDIMYESDIMIANIPQNLSVLKRYIDDLYMDKIHYLIGNYDMASRYSEKRLLSEIRKIYKKKITISHISHLAEFSDAIQNTELLRFFYRNENVTEEDYNYNFMQSVRDSFKRICMKYEKMIEVHE